MIKFESINNFLKLIGGKWKIKILAELLMGHRRFYDLKYILDGFNERMLIREMRNLENDTLIKKRINNKINDYI